MNTGNSAVGSGRVSFPPKLAATFGFAGGMKEETRRQIAVWRYGILGPLVSAELERGDLGTLLELAAMRTYIHPSGRRVRVSARTIETWYYRHKKHGLRGLEPQTRKDAGCRRKLDDELCALIVRAKKEKPGRSIRWLIRILERARKVRPGELSTSTVHRILKAAGVSTRPRKRRERRSFLVAHAGDLWVGDVMHGPLALVDERKRKTYLINILDAATRSLVASRFCLSEDATAHEGVLKEALRIYGRPRTYYVDRGAAYVAESLRVICAELGIHLLHTQPRDCEAKGSVERLHKTWRAEVGVELPDEALPLAELEAKHWAWLSREYHARVHSTTKRKPLEHLLAEAEAGHLRPLARGLDLDAVFMHRTKRKVRKDGTVSLEGRRLEVQAELVGSTVELRWDPHATRPRPTVWRDGSFVCDTVELDLLANATRKREREVDEPAPVEPTGLEPLEDLEREHYGNAGGEA